MKAKTEVKHTPTPWILNRTIVDGKIIGWHIAGKRWGSSYPVCRHRVEEPIKDGPSFEEQEANASLIVRAVNSHEALILMLENVRAELVDRHDTIDGPEGRALPNWAMSLTTEIEQVLAKAEAK